MKTFVGYVWAAHEGQGRLYVAIPRQFSPRGSVKWSRCDIDSLPGATVQNSQKTVDDRLSELFPSEWVVAQADQVGLIPKDGTKYYFMAIFGPSVFEAEMGVPCMVPLTFKGDILAPALCGDCGE